MYYIQLKFLFYINLLQNLSNGTLCYVMAMCKILLACRKADKFNLNFNFSSENSLAEVIDSGAYNNVIFICKIIYSLWPCELQRIL